MAESRLRGRAFLTFKWREDAHSNLVYNQEGTHQTIATPGDIVRTQLVTQEALDRFVSEGKAEYR